MYLYKFLFFLKKQFVRKKILLLNVVEVLRDTKLRIELTHFNAGKVVLHILLDVLNVVCEKKNHLGFFFNVKTCPTIHSLLRSVGLRLWAKMLKKNTTK